MGMPWDREPPRQEPPQYPQQMQPDVPPVPVVARNPQTGDAVRLDLGADLRAAIQQAVAGAVAENKDALTANAQRAMVKAVQGQKPTVSAPTPAALANSELEGDFEMGPATKRTLLQGLAIDVGFAAMAALATIASSDFNPFEKEAWTLVAVLMIKTVMQTGMSYMMRLKVD